MENYVKPDYYDYLLKDYIFKGKTDLQLFAEHFATLTNKKWFNAIELGCGSGRATLVFLNYIKTEKYNLKLVDLSNRMLKFSKERFINNKNLKFIKSDSLKFLEKDNDTYDLIFSLWSFSHSVHQTLIKMGYKHWKKYIQSIMKKVIEKNMTKGSSFFIIHFDSMSDEQKILMQQWKKAYPILSNLEIQSPSKIILDEILKTLEKQKKIKLKLTHYEGEEIIYPSIEKALETFLNFHLESHFNKSPILPQIINELVNYFENFTDQNGFVRIKPGCFVYNIEKI
jgi:SAM-dependent methyltransferase